MTHLPTQLARKLINRTNARGLLAVAICGAATLAVTPASALADDDAASFWTQFAPSEDTRLIFVSSSEGNDNNSGFSPNEPVASLDKAYELLRDGYPDWMLLKRGDVWYESLPSPSKSGRSEDAKLVVGAYGDSPDRPRILIQDSARGLQSNGSTKLKHLAYVGLRLEAINRDAEDKPIGIRWLRPATDLLFEDLYISGFKDNIILQNLYHEHDDLESITINGCVIVDAWSSTSHAQGIFASHTKGLSVTNCVIDHNGWSTQNNANPTIFNHNLYIQFVNEDVTIRNNIISNASSHGVQLRSGGKIEGNFFYSNPLSIMVGAGNETNSHQVTGLVANNLVMYGRQISDELPRALGIEAKYNKHTIVDSNIIYSAIDQPNISPFYTGSASSYSGHSQIAFTNNTIANWNGPVKLKPVNNDGVSSSHVLFSGNTITRDMSNNKPTLDIHRDEDINAQFSGNTYLALSGQSHAFDNSGSQLTPTEWQANYEPSAVFDTIDSPPTLLDIENYLALHLPGMSRDDFMNEARKLSRSSYNPSLMADSLISWARGWIGQQN